MTSPSKFVADIGGTHARFALVSEANEQGQGTLVKVKVFKCADFDTAAGTFEAYQKHIGGPLPARGCIAAAGPVEDGVVKFTNLGWRLSARELQEKLQLTRLELVNDFTAVAYSVANLDDEDLFHLHRGSRERDGVRVVLGAGTGLGVAALAKVGGEQRILDSEGGHVRFAPANKLENSLLEYLLEHMDYVSVEQVLSGRGVKMLYHALGEIYGVKTENLLPHDITHRAKLHSDKHCVTTIEAYAGILAGFCTTSALMFRARGGIHLVGDIFRSIMPFLRADEFTQRYCEGGVMSELVDATWLSLVLVEDPGLQGAANRALTL